MDKVAKKEKDKREKGSKKRMAGATVHTTFRFIFSPDIIPQFILTKV